VVEPGAPEERIDLVAFSTVRGESGEEVVRICRFLKISAMTYVTSCRRPCELITGCIGMAILAIERRVSTQQRKSRELMPLDHVGDLPRLKPVAARAISTELGFVDIDMTRRAELTGADESELLMTADARSCLVLAVQRKAGLRMIERCVSSHLPGIRLVTRLTRNLEFAVRRCLSQTGMDHCDKQANDQRSLRSHFPPS
jgi:hypothetical protein